MLRGSIKQNIIGLTRRRLIANYINAIVLPLIVFTPIWTLMYFTETNQLNSVLILISVIFGLIFQFGFFVVLTNGYTPGGIIMRTKIVKLDGKKLKLKETIKRFLSAWNAILIFQFFIKTKVNSIGQLYYDKKFNTTIISSKAETPKYTKVYDIEYNYLKELLIFFAALAFLSNFLSWLFK